MRTGNSVPQDLNESKGDQNTRMKSVTRNRGLFKSGPVSRRYPKGNVWLESRRRLEIGNEYVEPAKRAPMKERRDARSYRKYLISEMQKSGTPNNLGKRSRDSLVSETIPSIFPKRKRCKESNVKPAANVKNRGVCTVCKLEGELFCNGRECNRSYHLSCLDPPFIEAPPGIWHCIWCVQKKMELGVQSVSRGPESIWDFRQVMSNHKEIQQKEYLVKFKGLAHVHNQWIPETKLLAEAPLLIAKFERKIKLTGWRQQWTVPHRLLQKRSLSFAGQHEDISQEHESHSFSCRYEWLVKWKGLGYDQATWELENASFLTSTAAMDLIRDYETRHLGAERSSCPSQGMEARLLELSEVLSSRYGTDYCYHLSYVKRLFELWSKGCGSFVIGNKIAQERVMRVVLFLLSLPPTLSRPILIITSPLALSVWEDELLHMAPLSNFVVYKGNKELRSSIRFLEFYNESGGTKFEILLSTLNTVVEDFEMLRHIAWNITVIDECQCSAVLSNTEYLKKLSAHMKLLISSDEIKDSSSDYLNLLSLFNPKFGKIGLGDDDCALDIKKCKEELSPYLVYECKLHPVKFVEYWVPVHISNVQLEQYCNLLLSNLAILCHASRNGSVGAIREIILETRKCCDHPLLLDRSLSTRIREGLPTEEYLKAEVEMSGKLLFLDRILLEMSQEGLRALIIFQSIEGSGLDSTGYILEDYVRQRFGDGCYVRIDGSDHIYSHSKKRAAIDMFNDKKSGKFIFLIDKRSCHSSIKLFSVDSVILFNSSWDPRSDLGALHRIAVSPQFKQLKVFRLYSCHTVEEKLLILAKEGAPIENGIKFTSHKTCHTLLHWGAAHLFSKLDVSHGCQTSASSLKIYSDSLRVDAVFRELASVLVGNERLDDRSKFVLEMQQYNGVYNKNALLQGEMGTIVCNTIPFDFWKTLNENRYPKWHFITKAASMIRRKSQFGDARATRQQVLENQVNRVEKRSEAKKNSVAANKDHKVTERDQKLDPLYSSDCHHPVVDHSSGVRDTNRMELSESDELASPKERLSSLRLNLMKLCSVLKLPRDVKDTAVAFLKFLQEGYEVDWESDDTLEAFQISLCWTAACMLNHKINHKESVRLAKDHLKFDCEVREATYIYKRLRDAKRTFVEDRLEDRTSKNDLNDMRSSRLSTLDDTDLVEQVLVTLDGGRSSGLSLLNHQNMNGKDIVTGLPVQDSTAEVVQRSEAGLFNHAEKQSTNSQVENLVNPCANQDLEEGEIPPYNEAESVIPIDFRAKLAPELEGEIPTHSQLENLVNPLVEEGEIPPVLIEQREILIKHQTEFAPGLEGKVLAYSQQENLVNPCMYQDTKTTAMPSQSAGNVSSGKRIDRDLDKAELPPVNSEEQTTSALKRVQHSAEGGIQVVLRRKVRFDESPDLEGLPETLQAQNILEHPVSAHFEEMPTSLVSETNPDEEMDEAKVQEDHRIEAMQLRPDKGTGALLDERFRISSPSTSNGIQCVPETSNHSGNEKNCCIPVGRATVTIESDSDIEEVEATDPRKALAACNSCEGSYPESDSVRQNLPEAAQVRSAQVMVIDEKTENPIQGMSNQGNLRTSPGPSVSNQAVPSTYGTQVPRQESGVPAAENNNIFHGLDLRGAIANAIFASQDNPPLLNPITADSCSCPLRYEMEKLQLEQEHALKTYEYVVASIRADRYKPIEDVNKSHNLLFHLLEEKLKQNMKERDAKLAKLKAARAVAEVLRKAETESPADVSHYRPPVPASPVRPANDRMPQISGQLRNECPLLGGSTLNSGTANMYQTTAPRLQNTGWLPFILSPPAPPSSSHHNAWGNAAVNNTCQTTRWTDPRLPFILSSPPPSMYAPPVHPYQQGQYPLSMDAWRIRAAPPNPKPGSGYIRPELQH